MRSPSLVTFKARAAPTEPLSACARSLLREAAVSAVSDPEKNPESTRSTKIAPEVIKNLVLSSKCSITCPIKKFVRVDDVLVPNLAFVYQGYVYKFQL
jgi:hypothetical protein